MTTVEVADVGAPAAALAVEPVAVAADVAEALDVMLARAGNQPHRPRKTAQKTPINQIMCNICSEFGHHTNTCEHINPRAKAHHEVHQAASKVTKLCELQDATNEMAKLHSQILKFKAQLLQHAAGRASEWEDYSEGEGEDDEDEEGIAGAAMNFKRSANFCLPGLRSVEVYCART